MYRDCILCKYVPKLDGFKMSNIEKFEVDAEEEKKEDFENMEQDSMVLFYAPWCPHCKTVMGDWAKLKKSAPNGVKIAKVNCDEKPELAEKHDIKGFPTIILFKNGKKVYFEGPRNLENFLEFIKSN
jgi:protein disulfide-isomerase-like protein